MRGKFLPLYIILLYVVSIRSQFPADCNNPASLSSKTCCPNECGGIIQGNCTNITEQAIETWDRSWPDVVSVIKDSPNLPGKGKADFRYRWPTVVFEKVCVCGGNYYGADCTECKFGYTGADCKTKKNIVTRKTFSRLTQAERDSVVEAYSLLKKEYGRWSVVVEEPLNYTSGSVTLQNVSTYDMIVHLHSTTGRDEICQGSSSPTVNFAHEGPAFPVWHRHYLLFLERQMQRILGNESFALPHWSWDIGEMEMFTEEHLGTPASAFNQSINITSSNFNSSSWPVVCDLVYRNQSLACADAWKVCNPQNDRVSQRPLQRGQTSKSSLAAYLPTAHEVSIAISAASYDTSDQEGNYGVGSPSSSFRNRLEGFTRICSASNCVGFHRESHMHNVVHLWLGGHMSIVPSAVNDPIFFLHHCNVDRVLESWIRKFVVNSSNPFLLPGYAPARGGHPGHNKVDWMVPFFPLVRPIDYYNDSEALGYVYEELFENNVQDSNLSFCNPADLCASCLSSNGTCINCGTSGMSDNCRVEQQPVISTSSPILSQDQILLILVLGIPLLVCLILLVFLIMALICIAFRKGRKQ